jgi:hypothetical protein
MPNINPLITSRSDNQPLFAPVVEDVEGLPYGVSYNNGWTPLGGGTSTISTIIQVPGIQLGSPVHCTVQLKARGQQNLTDAVNCWITAAYVTPGQIFVYVYAGGTGTNGAPVDNANYGISWVVSGNPV